jgi:hypothetical protein
MNDQNWDSVIDLEFLLLGDFVRGILVLLFVAFFLILIFYNLKGM